MKRFLVYLLAYLLILPAGLLRAGPVPSIYRMVGSGTVTKANTKISAVNGAAFIDFSDSETVKLVDSIGHLLKIKDSAGKVIQGYIKAAGTGETLDSELVLNGTFTTDTSNWVQGPVGSHATLSVDTNRLKIVKVDGGAGYGQALQAIATTNGWLIKFFANGTNGNAGPYLRIDPASGASNSYINQIYTSGNLYKTIKEAGNTTINLFVASVIDGKFCYWDNVSLRQVLTPSATGVTISSTKSSAGTENWAQKDSAFNYNDSSGYTYEIWHVNSTTLLDTDAVANADATVNMNAGSASWVASGVDDSAYLDGRHVIHLTDDNGVVAFGYYESAAAGAVVNTNGGSTNNWISIGAGFSTAGDFTRRVYFVGD